MSEDAFLQAIQQKPDDDTTRLVYADWLEEQSDEASRTRAAFIRLDCQLAALPARSIRRAALRKRRRQLARDIDPGWMAVVSKADIERCAFRYECPLKWENLTPTDEGDTVRFCDKCAQNVHYCASIEEARSHAWLGHCVAVDARLTRKQGDLDPPHQTVVGMLS